MYLGQTDWSQQIGSWIGGLVNIGERYIYQQAGSPGPAPQYPGQSMLPPTLFGFPTVPVLIVGGLLLWKALK